MATPSTTAPTDAAPAMTREEKQAKLASPDRLDTFLHITNNIFWLGLVGLIFLLLVTIVWGIFGSISTRVNGAGVLLRGPNLLEVASQQGATVVELKVNVGDKVSVGQVLAILERTEIEEQIRQAEQEFNVFEEQQKEMVRLEKENFQTQMEFMAEQLENNQEMVSDYEQLLKLVQEQNQIFEDLMNDGLITRQQYLESRNNLITMQMDLAQAKAQRSNIQSTRAQVQQQHSNTLFQLNEQLRQRRFELDLLKLSQDIDFQVVSNVSGRVVDVTAARGRFIGEGQPVALIEEDAAEIDAVVYVSPELGKEVEVGMEIQIDPTTVQREEYGFIIGKVDFISPFPATPDSMLNVLGNQTMVQELTAKGAPLLVRATLEKDPKSPSGLKWSSGEGPHIDLTTGTPVTAQVVTREQPPITLVIPFVRRMLGID